MECCLCTNSQYITKYEYSMNLRINIQTNDVWRADGSLYDKHLQNPGQKCNKHAKFTIIEKNNASLPKGFNASLNQDTTGFICLSNFSSS